MVLKIACPQCGEKYQVAEQLAGKQARCQKCTALFFVEAPALSPFDPLAELVALPAVASPLGPSPATATPAVTAPIAGPSDAAMRLGSGALAIVGLILLIGTFVMDRLQGAIYIAPLVIAPLGLILGVAGAISPNIVRAAGKYGRHLPWQYKEAAGGLLALSLLGTILLVMWP